MGSEIDLLPEDRRRHVEGEILPPDEPIVFVIFGGTNDLFDRAFDRIVSDWRNTPDRKPSHKMTPLERAKQGQEAKAERVRRLLGK